MVKNIIDVHYTNIWKKLRKKIKILSCGKLKSVVLFQDVNYRIQRFYDLQALNHQGDVCFVEHPFNSSDLRSSNLYLFPNIKIEPRA